MDCWRASLEHLVRLCLDYLDLLEILASQRALQVDFIPAKPRILHTGPLAVKLRPVLCYKKM